MMASPQEKMYTIEDIYALPDGMKSFRISIQRCKMEGKHDANTTILQHRRLL